MKKTAGKIWSIVTTLLLVLIMVVVAAMYVPKLFGIEPLIVLSGSMEPTYPVGSLVYVKSIEQDDIKEDTPITFKLGDGSYVTHRVVRQAEDGNYVTKGDANDVEDGTTVSYDNIIGTPVFHINKLGTLADKLGTTTGKVIFATVVVVIIILMLMGDMIFGEDKKAAKKEEGADEKDNE